MTTGLLKRAVAEGAGTALLLAAVVGSGIMATRLSGGNVALALLANAIATGGALVALIVTFAPVSGAHFNPLVTLALLPRESRIGRDALAYIAAQLVGAVGGVFLAHAMFGLPIVEWSGHVRATPGEWLGEFVATFGLIGLITSGVRHRSAALPYAVAAYITAAYWFTSSTSFANPAVALARALTDSFAGIRPQDVPAFVAAEVAGGVVAAALFRWLLLDSKPANNSGGM